MYILRREGLLNDDFAGKILASYTSRPRVPDDFENTCMELLVGYNAECLVENVNTSFIRFMERNRRAHLLAEGVEFARSISPNTRQSTTYGIYPSPKNKKHVLKRVIQYANEKIIVGYDDDEQPVYDFGVCRINDIHLLEEMKQFNDDGNFDRIDAFGYALCWAEWLDEIGVKVESRKTLDKKKKKKKDNLTHKNFYNIKKGRKSGFYSK